MSNFTVSVIRNISRDEYAAIAKPFRGQRKLLISAICAGVAFIFLIFLVLSGVGLTLYYLKHLRVVVSPQHVLYDIVRACPIFFDLSIVYGLIYGNAIGNIFARSRAGLFCIFPNLKQRETITTQLTSYGILQSSGSGGALTPWVNVVRIEEISEAFILHIQAARSVRWVPNFDLLYIMKPEVSLETQTITSEVLEEYRSLSAVTPNYSWHSDLVRHPGGRSAAEDVWPPPPVTQTPKSDAELQLAGTLRIAVFRAYITDRALLLDYTPVIKLQFIAIAPVLIFAFMLSSLIMVVGVNVLIALILALPSCGLFGYYLWRSSSVIRLDWEKSLMTLNGSKFASISEIDSIDVIDKKSLFKRQMGRQRAYIEIRTTGGKVQRLSFEAFIDAAETNVIAMLLGQYLTECLTSATPNNHGDRV